MPGAKVLLGSVAVVAVALAGCGGARVTTGAPGRTRAAPAPAATGTDYVNDSMDAHTAEWKQVCQAIRRVRHPAARASTTSAGTDPLVVMEAGITELSSGLRDHGYSDDDDVPLGTLILAWCTENVPGWRI